MLDGSKSVGNGDCTTLLGAGAGLHCVSRNSVMTFALLPLGPFFCGIALYVQSNELWPQFRHGCPPVQRTLRRWQASQARFIGTEGAFTSMVEMPAIER